MRTKRALDIRMDTERALDELWNRARHFGWTSGRTETERRKLLERKGVNKTPRWVATYLAGYWNCLVHIGYRNDFVFGGYVNETFYSTHRDRPDYYEKHGIEPREFADDGNVSARGHYWRESLKPWFTGIPGDAPIAMQLATVEETRDCGTIA